MTFSENNSLLPGGSVSASEVKKLNEKIDDLSQTVTSIADSVSALSNEVNTSSLNASNAVIDNATIGSETVSSADITSAEIDSADITDADITNAEVNDLTADNASITDLTVSQAYVNSVNSASFTGQSIHVSENIQSDKNLISDGLNTNKATITDKATVKDIEITGKSVVRGDVQFPENGDKIYGEYLDVEANNLKAKSLTTQTPSGSSQLVGYDSNGKLIPVDASLDPANLWENDPDEENAIRPKDEKFVKTSGIIADEGDIAELNSGDLASENITADDVTITTSLNSEGSATFDSADVTNNATVGNDLNVDGDLDVDGDTTLADTTVDGTLQVNGDIIQNGSAYETHAEKVYTKDDLIITRDGAVGALGPTEVTGIQAEAYDGTNDGQLVFDRNGEARVGDVGDTEPLLTRDELANMTDARPLVWDGTNSKAVTGSSAQADALNSGITASDVTQIGDNTDAIGDLSDLTTTDKTDLVSAINEVSGSIGTPDVSNVTGVLPITNGGTGASTKNIAKANMGNYSVYMGGSGFNFDSSSITLTIPTPLGANNFINGDIITVYVRTVVRSSVAVNTVLFSFAGRTETVDCGGNDIKSHEYTSANPNYNASYPHVVFAAGTTLTLMYDSNDEMWHIIGNPEVDSYHDANGNGYKVYADGYIEQWGVVTTFIASGDKTTIDVPVHYSSSTSWMGLSWYGASSGNTGSAHTGYGVLIPQNTYQFTTGAYSSNNRISYMVKGY